MAISPMYTGAGLPVWQLQALKDNSTADSPKPQDLTGGTPSIRFQQIDGTTGVLIGASFAGSGNVAVTDAVNGKFNYTVSANDLTALNPSPGLAVNVSAYFIYQIKVAYAGGNWESDIYTLQVTGSV